MVDSEGLLVGDRGGEGVETGFESRVLYGLL